ncbi:MAG: holdfast polysaccharide polymerase HfsG [Oceanicaulis sp. HLUCCA04]|nr:MAG: holdfast polysaccharide polymerase HfsG [Oceanicaulis sp. HLUCCA04]
MSQPFLSVLIPFHGDDPASLLDALLEQADSDTEIVLFDDGSPDTSVFERLSAHLAVATQNVRVLRSDTNLQRSGARNALADAADGEWLLYLDADMEIPAGFLPRWVRLIKDADFDAAYGGYTLPEAQAGRYAVHAGLARAGDVNDAAARSRRGASAFAGSNMAVRAELMARIRFDETYRGWGWEDVDWAVRAGRAGRLAHVDNPAGHGGLQSVDSLLAKFAEGGLNYARFLARHPDQASLPGARLARLLAQWNLFTAVKALTPALTRASALPVRARVLALKAYKAACAAAAFREVRP